MAERRKLYTIRTSYLYQAKHNNDVYLNLGYKYTGNILKKGTSPEIWANPLQSGMYGVLEGLLTYILESAKYVKKWMSIAIDKNSTLLN